MEEENNNFEDSVYKCQSIISSIFVKKNNNNYKLCMHTRQKEKKKI